MVLHWSLSDSKSPQVSRTLLSILATLNTVVICMVSTRPPTSKSSCPLNNPLVTVPNASITLGKIVTFMFQKFFNSLARSKCLSFFSLSSSFILWSARTAKSTVLQVIFFLLITLRSGLLAEIWWSVCMSKSLMSLYVSLTICHLLVWSNLNFLHISQSYTPSVLICCIRLLCDWSFCLYHHITYICYLVTSYLLSLWFEWFLWRCFVLL